MLEPDSIGQMETMGRESCTVGILRQMHGVLTGEVRPVLPRRITPSPWTLKMNTAYGRTLMMARSKHLMASPEPTLVLNAASVLMQELLFPGWVVVQPRL